MNEALRIVGRRHFILHRVAVNAILFRPDFHDWLESNMPLWERFEHEANRVYERGRRHYGARTIWEVLRHESMVSEAHSDFKLNNNFAPCLARLYMLMYPERKGFFELRRAA